MAAKPVVAALYKVYSLVTMTTQKEANAYYGTLAATYVKMVKRTQTTIKLFWNKTVAENPARPAAPNTNSATAMAL